MSKMELSRLNNSALINAMSPTIVPEPERVQVFHASWNKFFNKQNDEFKKKLQKMIEMRNIKRSQQPVEFDIMNTPMIPFFCVEREEFIK